jgi:CBS domain containing-hemolysin-like protein
MITFVIGLLLAAMAVIFWTLLRVYQHVPVHEMKRLARGGDGAAQLLYKAGAYGTSLRAVLSGGTVVLTGLALLVLVQALGVLLGIGLLLLVLAVGLVVFVPADELTHSSLWLAKRSAPGLAWVLYRLHPVADAAVRTVRRFRHVSIHTGLYEKSDLMRLLERQRDQPDSRISTAEVDLLLHSLSFGDCKVGDAMVPKRVVKTVAATEHIGPVLMDELSRSGHSRFPVYDQKHDNIVGVLFLRKLVAGKQSGIVADVMSRQLTYVHEDFTLLRTLQAFLRTKQHLFLVVNSFEELVGVITIEDVLEQMIGRQIVDEFDHYDDLRAVAAAAARKDHTGHSEPKPEAVGAAPES